MFNDIKQRFTAILVISFLLLGGSFVFALAQESATSDDIAVLQEQVNVLLAQIEDLKTKIADLKSKQGKLRVELSETKLELRTQLRDGLSGKEIEILQAFLATDPDIYPKALITGYFGPLTAQAVKNFQKKQGIEQVGEIGPKTRAAINDILGVEESNQEGVPDHKYRICHNAGPHGKIVIITVGIPATVAHIVNHGDTYGFCEDDGDAEVLPACSDEIDNDGDGLVDTKDPACHTDGDGGNPNSYDPNIDSENQKPTIALIGDDPLILAFGVTFTDPGAEANDPEDGDITSDIVTGGDTVDTKTAGSYTITYNVEDFEGLPADEVTRVVTVSENQKPTIILLGDDPIELTVGDTFADPGAEANDPEDGDITSDIVTGGDVDTSTVGTYTVTYNVTDSKGLSADEVTRVVSVTDDDPGNIFNEF